MYGAYMIKATVLTIFAFTSLIYSVENINRDAAIDKSFKYHNSFDNAALKFIEKAESQKSVITNEKNRIKPEIIVELTSSIKKSDIKLDLWCIFRFNFLSIWSTLK